MNTSFNQIIVNLLIEFIDKHKLIAYEPSLGLSNNQRKYIFGHHRYGKSLSECYKNISTFDIFKPISQFNYNNHYHLIKFESDYNLKLFSIFLKQFLHTEYENLFFSTVTKIIPIDYCIENQPWEIVKKLLIIKPYKSNGLPEVENSKRFFELLLNYNHESDFEVSFLKFCQFNKSLLKRTENQEYLKIFLKKSNIFEKFKSFIIEINQPLTEVKQNYFSFYIHKKVLFSNFSDTVNKKNEPVDKLIEIFSELDKYKINQSLIHSLFIEQKEEKFPELLVFISFTENLNYSFEDYYLYLLDYFLKNNISVHDNIEKVSSYFFLGLKLPTKSIIKKEKTAKI